MAELIPIDSAALAAAAPVRRSSLNKPQVTARHYDHAYETKMRLASYWHQVDEVLLFEPATVLEVGMGSGFVSAALKRENIRVVTADVAQDLRPDILGSVMAIPLADDSIDVTLCCQVLEHLPFHWLSRSVAELWRVCRRGMVISLPDVENYLRVGFKLGDWLAYHALHNLPRRPSRRPCEMDPEHCWEIGCADIGLPDVIRAIRTVTAKTPRTYRIYENPYHRFFTVPKL